MLKTTKRKLIEQIEILTEAAFTCTPSQMNKLYATITMKSDRNRDYIKKETSIKIMKNYEKFDNGERRKWKNDPK